MISTKVALLVLPLTLVWIAAMLLGGGAWVPDLSLLGWAYANDRPTLVMAALVITPLGGWQILMSVTALTSFLLLKRKNNREALLVLIIVFTGRLLVDMQKFLFARARPEAFEQLVSVHSTSFPSGHSANAMITYLTIALLVGRGHPVAIVVALLLIGAIGISRVVLGVHWPSDVAGGWAFGAIWTLTLTLLFGNADGWRRGDLPNG